ncbi:MAG: hypothetical protein JF615_14600 [Asticcacaulis sp.]|nr:hypothetical protein [Asticcacaulis sp.]
MSQRSRISLTVDVSSHILMIRLHSLGDAHETPDLIDHVNDVAEPWSYDAILDFRRYEAELSHDYLIHLGQKWVQLAQGRDLGRRLALISPCPVLSGQLLALAKALPGRGLAVFESFDDGLDWIKASRTCVAA